MADVYSQGILTFQRKSRFVSLFSNLVKMNSQPSSVPPLLPRFPNAPLDKCDLDKFSDSLISAYTSIRFTTPYQHQKIIKGLAVKLPPQGSMEQPSTTVRDPLILPGSPSSPLWEETVPIPCLSVQAASPDSAIPDEQTHQAPQKCFLHPKPKASCQRCGDYLEAKKMVDTSQTVKKSRHR